MTTKNEVEATLWKVQEMLQTANGELLDARHNMLRLGLDDNLPQLARELSDELAKVLQGTYGLTIRVQHAEVEETPATPETPEGETTITRCAITGRLNRTAVVRYGHGGKTHVGEATSFNEGKSWQAAANCLARRGDGNTRVVSVKLADLANVTCGTCRKLPIVALAAKQ